MLPNWLKALVGFHVALAIAAVLVGLTGLHMKQVYKERDQLQALQPNVRTLQDRLNASEKTISSLVAEQNRLQQEVAETRSAALSTPKQLEANINSVYASLEASQKKISSLEGRLGLSEQKVSSLLAQQKDFQVTLAANSTNIGFPVSLATSNHWDANFKNYFASGTSPCMLWPENKCVLEFQNSGIAPIIDYGTFSRIFSAQDSFMNQSFLPSSPSSAYQPISPYSMFSAYQSPTLFPSLRNSSSRSINLSFRVKF
jgi:uncharacterized membrane-anchored protein YhcB (DUF1043 family)